MVLKLYLSQLHQPILLWLEWLYALKLMVILLLKLMIFLQLSLHVNALFQIMNTKQEMECLFYPSLYQDG